MRSDFRNLIYVLKAQSFELCVLSSELSTLCSELRTLSSGVGTQNLGPCVLNAEFRSVGFEFRSVSSELTGGAFTISQRCAGLGRAGGVLRILKQRGRELGELSSL